MHQANIKLQGFTLLTGAPNTGKSTLAKALYACLSIQPHPYTGALAPLKEALHQLYQLEVEYGLQEDEIILADLAPNIYLSFYQRAVEKVVQAVRNLEKEQQGLIHRADAQSLVRSCNILRHLGGKNYVEVVVAQLKQHQLVVPKTVWTGKTAHDQLIATLFIEGYANHQGNSKEALLDLYKGNTAGLYQKVEGNTTTALTFKGQVFSEVLLLEMEDLLAILTGKRSFEEAPIYTQEILKK